MRIDRLMGARIVPGLLLALALGPLSAAAQEADGRLARIRDQLPASTVLQIEERIASAREQGLPVEPLLDKAVEGIAKNVPGDRIAGAVDALAVELDRARSLLANGVAPAATDIAAVADALRRGVPQAAIRELAHPAETGDPGPQVALAVHTLGDLMDRGVSADQALAVLKAWSHTGSSVEELRQLPAAVERLIRQGVLPEHAAAAVAGAMSGSPAGLSGGQPGHGHGLQGQPPIPPGAGPPADKGKGKGPPTGGAPTGG